MKSLNLRTLAASLVFPLLLLAGCNTEQVEPNVPEISVDASVVYLDSEQGEFTIEVNTNRDWQVVIPDHVEWLMATPSSGSGPATVTFDYGSNDYIQHEAVIRIATATVWSDVLVVQKGAVASTVLLYESMGRTNVTTTPEVSTYTGWLRDGMGASGVVYSGSSTTTIRTSLPSSGAYLGASGGNDCYFGSVSSNLVVSDIDIKDNPRIQLEFGCSKSEGGVLTEFSEMNLTVQSSFDGGVTWGEVEYTRTDYSGWGLASSTINVVGGASKMSLKFIANVAGSIRIDDISVTGIGGEEITAPVVTTLAPTSTTTTTADVSARYAYMQPIPEVTAFGIRYKPASATEYAPADQVLSPIAVINTFSATLSGLTTGQKYTYQGFVTTSDGVTTYGNEETVVPEYPAIYLENFGTATANQPIATWNGYQKGGTGGANATYTVTGTGSADLRTSAASAGYPGASGGLNMFFNQPSGGADGTNIVIGNITLGNPGAVGFRLSFGLNAAMTAMPNLSFSTDGISWSPVTINGKTNDEWEYVSADIVPPTGASTISFKFEPVYRSLGTRVDDIKLVRDDYVPIPTAPTVITGTVSSPGAESADVTGNMYTWYNMSAGDQVGVAYRVSGTSTWTYTAATGTASPFNVTLTSLTAATTYEYAAYVWTGGVYTLGDTKTFTTSNGAISFGEATVTGMAQVGVVCTATISIPYTNATEGRTISATPSWSAASTATAAITTFKAVTPVTVTSANTSGTITVSVQNSTDNWTPTGNAGWAVISVALSDGTSSDTKTGNVVCLGPNLLSNPGFETYTTSPGVPEEWSASSTAANAAVITKVTTNTRGTISANMAVPSGGTTSGLQQENIPVTASKNYYFSFWYINNTQGTSSQGSRIYSTFYTSANASAGAGTAVSGNGLQPSVFSPVTAWTQYETVVTAPATAAKVTFLVRSTQNQSATIDDCNVAEYPAPLP